MFRCLGFSGVGSGFVHDTHPQGRFWLDLPTPPSTPDVGRDVFQFGPRSNLDSIVPFVGRMILLTHSSRLEKGPEERSPSSSIAYQPRLMPRMSDLSSLM